MAGNTLRQRVVTLEAGKSGETGKSWTGLRIGFNIEKTDNSAPNQGKILIYNLNENSRAFLETKGIAIVLKAGYEQATIPTIFKGSPKTVTHNKTDVDWITEIEAYDGYTAIQNTRLMRTYDGPIYSSQIIESISSAMGLQSVTIPAEFPDTQFLSGYTIAGQVKNELDILCKSGGAKWSIQDNELVITMAGKPTGHTAVLLTPDTGLIGSPEKMSNGRIKAVSLIQAGLNPRRLVQVKSNGYTGTIILKKVNLVGDSGYDVPFYANLEGVEVLT